jgi:hypothetical protein
MSPLAADAIQQALEEFAREVTRKSKSSVAGDPEAQLRGPLEVFMGAAASALGHDTIIKGESRVDELGRPDFAISVKNLLIGYVELKPTGTGADPSYFKGHDKTQWERFRLLPNILYTDGNQWALFQRGSLVNQRVTLHGDVTRSGVRAVQKEDAERIEAALWGFFSWKPIVPQSPAQLARMLAPLCRLLQREVLSRMLDKNSTLARMSGEWRDLLFPGADDGKFANEYAQTIVYALLLAKSERASTLDIHKAAEALRPRYTLLAKALEVLTDERIRREVPVPLDMLQRVIDEVKPEVLTLKSGSKVADPWLYFYEEFLAEYDPDMRRDMGVYYTPVPVVRAQVRLVDETLTKRMGKRFGFADEGVITLDPAVGTGTYLLGIIEHALNRVGSPASKGGLGEGAVPAKASELAETLYGFEVMAGPYAVAELRVAQQLEAFGATLPTDAPHIYLTNTLESPHTKPPAPALFYDDIAREHERALKVKEEVPVLVCIGNPPYDRHPATGDRFWTGGWVRHGDEGDPNSTPVLEDFLKPVRDAGKGGQLKNLYNLYVYFWRWALWKVFEHEGQDGPGVVTFISASSYIDGDAFAGMREHMRRLCDEVWIIDLGGEGRGPRRSENVFNIQTPVAIAVAVRYGAANKESPAKVSYARVEGTRQEKFDKLDSIVGFSDLEWSLSADGWSERFRPVGSGDFFTWPELIDLFPWQHSGSQYKRKWPIAPDASTLQRRWRRLLASNSRAVDFKETRDRRVGKSYPAFEGSTRLKPIAELDVDEPAPSITRYAYRSLDRQYSFFDPRLGDFLRPALWHAHGDQQIYVASLLTKTLGKGPALVATGDIPDLDYFSARGAKDIIPLWRDRDATAPNMTTGLLNKLESVVGESVSPEDLLLYCYGVLSQPAYTEEFAEELGTSSPRVPITKDAAMYHRARDLGRELMWLHTYGERMTPKEMRPGELPPGTADCVQQISDDPDNYPEAFSCDTESETLTVGDGKISPVSADVWDYEVSGLHILQSWLSYRMRKPSGRKSSPLDLVGPERWTFGMTEELLMLISILEHTIELNKKQFEVFERIIAGPLFTADELPTPSEAERRPPAAGTTQGDTEQRSLKEALHPEAMFEEGLLVSESADEFEGGTQDPTA